MTSQTLAVPVPNEGTGLLRRVLATPADGPAAIARIALGLVLLPHGAQKLLGWFGGHGFAGTMGFLTGAMGLPYPVALAVVLIESLGALAVVVGLGGRLAAAGVAAVMIGATLTVHLANGFFMNWTGAQKGEGFEYHILAVALALIVMVRGSGAGSLDRVLSRRRT